MVAVFLVLKRVGASAAKPVEDNKLSFPNSGRAKW